MKAFKNLEGVVSPDDCNKIVSDGIEILGLSSENGLEEAVQTKLVNQGSKNYKLLSMLLEELGSDQIKWSPYTATRLSRAIEKYNSNRPKDLLNELLGRYYYDSCINGKNIVLEYPPLLQIELTSRCNYRCIFCYQSDTSFSSNSSNYMGFMDLDLFKTIIDEIEGYVPYITFASRGEPTLHPNFSEMLNYANGKFLDIKINTNASLLNQQKIKAILDNCDTIVFSIDTPNESEYPNIRVNGDLKRVINNIKLFNKIRKDHPRNNDIKTRAAGVYFDRNAQSFEEYRKVFGPLFDETGFVKYHPYQKIYEFKPNGIKTRCPQPFYRFFIWWDGSFNPCDMDYKCLLCSNAKKVSKDYSVKDAWCSKAMELIRDKHMQGDRSALDPCKKCPITIES